ncbi:MAG TPA: DinB family protein [Puia sp.]|nr:DinB family protein [Puia sp.]
MTQGENKEFWLRGPVPGIPALLQPTAHALLQAREEVNLLIATFPDALLWERPGGVASPGFHLQHLAGVLDRLLTYARGQTLDHAQLKDLTAEGTPTEGQSTVAELLNRFNLQVDKALDQISQTPEPTLTEVRYVGRARLPSTVAGLLFHAAEHTQRHYGQLFVTVKVLTAYRPSGNPYDK